MVKAFGERPASTFVPIPPSAIVGDALYDDRMLKLLLRFGEGLELDIRELVRQRKSTQPVRGAELRPSVSEIAENYYLVDSLVEPCPTTVWICDDVLTAGNHYKAMQSVIKQRFPEVPTIGLFIARRAPEHAAQLGWREKTKIREATRPPDG
jgi:hypothetical protein